MEKKKLSLEDKARKANGLDRSCKGCNHFPCPQSLATLCRDAFVQGYKKGYQQAMKERKERIDKVLHPVTDACGDNQIYVFMRDVRAGERQPEINLIRMLDVDDDFDISTLHFTPDHKGDPQQLQIAWCYPKDLIELLGYDKKFDKFERVALHNGWDSYPEKQYRENLMKNTVEREQHETLYDYKKRKEVKNV